MRSQWRFVGLLLLLALGGGCDNVAPLQIEEQTYELRVVGTSVGRIPALNVFDLYEDGIGERSLFCVTPVPAVTLLPTSVPWRYSIQIEILRAGETEPEIITSTAALDPDLNMTDYDTTSVTGALADKDPIVIGTRTFRFENPRRLSAANRDVMAATSNPLTQLDPATYVLGAGLCSNANPGLSNIDGAPQPISIVLNKGDTLLVQARKSDTAPPGVWYLPNEAAIRGVLLLDGSEITVRGNRTSSVATGAGFSFSFTSL
jgi:hypothetical protein